MKLLITGGAGFIGSALVRRAVASGNDVLNFDKLTYAGNLQAVASVEGSGQYRFLEADICDRQAVATALADFRPDVLFNLAAETHVDRSIDGPDDFIRTNINGVHALLEACRAWRAAGNAPDGFRLVHVSTDEVFGSIESGAFNETSPYQPNSPYSASKASSDMLVRAWHETFGLPAIITNCSNNYGPWQFPEKFIPTIILKALQGRPIPIYGDGQQVRDWLYVDDHADALLSVAGNGATGETYCIGGDSTTTNLKLAETVCDLVDARLGQGGNASARRLIEFVTDRPGHDRRYAIDHSKITTELGWAPSHDMAGGLAETVDWYLENRDWLAALAEKSDAGQRLGVLK